MIVCYWPLGSLPGSLLVTTTPYLTPGSQILSMYLQQKSQTTAWYGGQLAVANLGLGHKVQNFIQPLGDRHSRPAMIFLPLWCLLSFLSSFVFQATRHTLWIAGIHAFIFPHLHFSEIWICSLSLSLSLSLTHTHTYTLSLTVQLNYEVIQTQLNWKLTSWNFWFIFLCQLL